MGRWLASTIGRKQIIGLTGLGLSLFVLSHMLGNMLILAGPKAYNEYSHALISNPLIYAAEVGLIVIFVVHLGLALLLQIKNRGARDSRYAVMSNGPKGTSWTQRTLLAQGLVILVFVILHLVTFKYGTHYTADYGKGEIRDLHRLVIEVFNEPGYVIWYVVALVVLGLHLWHGVASVFQTFGAYHPRYQPTIKAISFGYAAFVMFGFLSQPLYVYFIHRG
ncbi:MAG TPA: succinate dehydrogenase cytochrome b subunit [Bdellovibrionales bacterium]|nr:succinate dehydrogenase cytochrome b subunit [Bdellovibrionales bacterium]